MIEWVAISRTNIEKEIERITQSVDQPIRMHPKICIFPPGCEPLTGEDVLGWWRRINNIQ
jgi:hypothetical protein